MIDSSLLATKLLAFLKLIFLMVTVQVSAPWHARYSCLFHNHM